MIKGLAHIGIYVKDMEASLRFYRDQLGFEVTDEARPGAYLVFCNKGTCLMELIERKNYEERTAGPIDHIAVEVTGIEELVADLREKGVSIPDDVSTMENLLGGVKNVFFEGPDHERIEFFEYLNR